MRRAAAAVCREAAELDTALDAEVWASGLLGSWWPPDLEQVTAGADPDFEIGRPLVDEVVQIGGPAALAALLAIGEVSESELGLRALEHVNTLLVAGVQRPDWYEPILDVEVLGTAVMREDVFDDGITILIEATHGDGERHAVGIYIDHNLGMLAKDILLAESIDRVKQIVAANPEEGTAVQVQSIEPGEAWTRINDAMALTDMTLDPPVNEHYAALRALAMLRADQLEGPFPEIATPEVTQPERERLVADFLASVHGEGFADDGDEAFVASLAIDFCADYVDGRPLRWSPVTVELFMTGWLPRKVLADRATFEAVPRALSAWVSYAAGRRGIPETAVAQTVAAIDEWTADMLAQVDAEHSGGPGRELLVAAEDAGIDVSDEQALATFIAGWNTRSDR